MAERKFIILFVNWYNWDDTFDRINQNVIEFDSMKCKVIDFNSAVHISNNTILEIITRIYLYLYNMPLNKFHVLHILLYR